MPNLEPSLFRSPLLPRDRTRHISLLLSIAMLHLLIILWLARSPPPERILRSPTTDVFTVSLATGRDTPAERMPPKTESRIGDPFRIPAVLGKLPAADASPMSGVTSASLGTAAADGCTIARKAGEAIGQDPSAMAELDALPPSVRTSADAVMLWNGQWLDLGETAAGIGEGSLRRVVEQVVDAAPAECRSAEALGPWFIPIPEGDRTVTIVIGSGNWHWADLIAPSADCPVAASAACRPGTMIQNAY